MRQNHTIPLLIIAVAAAAAAMLPLIWAGISALRPSAEIFRYLSPLSIHTLVPTQVTFGNIVALWTGPFARAMLNSALVTAITVAVGLVICSMAAFALAALQYRGRAAVFAAMVVSFLIPFDSIAVPLAQVFRDLDLQNSYAGLILPGIGNGLAVFLLRQFFLGIPRELAEAAMVDGLGWFGIFTKIYLPLSSVAIASFAGQYDVDYGQMFGGAVFTALLPMAVLLVFQRYFIASFATTGSKD